MAHSEVKIAVEGKADKKLLTDILHIRCVEMHGGYANVKRDVVGCTAFSGLIDGRKQEMFGLIKKAVCREQHLSKHKLQNVTSKEVVVITPRLEEWLLDLSDKAGVNPQQFNFESDPDKLHKQLEGPFVVYKYVQWLAEVRKLLRQKLRKQGKKDLKTPFDILKDCLPFLSLEHIDIYKFILHGAIR